MREVFEKGEYIPLEAAGTRSEHVIAFARRFLNTMIIVVVSRFVAKVLSSPGMTFEDMWEDTMVIVPESSEGATFRNVLTGEELARTRRQGFSGLACSGLFRESSCRASRNRSLIDRERSRLMAQVLAMILAGGRVGELDVLTFCRPKSVLPYGGLYRVIDFPMSNLAPFRHRERGYPVAVQAR